MLQLSHILFIYSTKNRSPLCQSGVTETQTLPPHIHTLSSHSTRKFIWEEPISIIIRTRPCCKRTGNDRQPNQNMVPKQKNKTQTRNHRDVWPTEVVYSRKRPFSLNLFIFYYCYSQINRFSRWIELFSKSPFLAEENSKRLKNWTTR